MNSIGCVTSSSILICFNTILQVSMGVAVSGLEEGSEFVPIFCPDGAALESHVTLFDRVGGR